MCTGVGGGGYGTVDRGSCAEYALLLTLKYISLGIILPSHSESKPWSTSPTPTYHT